MARARPWCVYQLWSLAATPYHGGDLCLLIISLTPDRRKRRLGHKSEMVHLWGSVGGLTILGCVAAYRAERPTLKRLLSLRARPKGRL
jgi:hypothetical protein